MRASSRLMFGCFPCIGAAVGVMLWGLATATGGGLEPPTFTFDPSGFWILAACVALGVAGAAYVRRNWDERFHVAAILGATIGTTIGTPLGFMLTGTLVAALVYYFPGLQPVFESETVLLGLWALLVLGGAVLGTWFAKRIVSDRTR